MAQLPVPYLSQLGNRPADDCGVACALMVAWAYGKGQGATVEGLYAQYGLPPNKPLYVSTIARILRDLGVPNTRHTGSLATLRGWLDERRPPILLIDYGPVVAAGLYQYAFWAGHFVVATGYDDGGFTVNDPYWRGQSGKDVGWPTNVMYDAWSPHDQYNFTAITPDEGLDTYSVPVQEDEMAGYREYLEQIQSLVEEALGPVAEPAPEMDVYQVTATDGLYLRQGPGQNYQNIRLMDYGEKVDLVSTDHAPWYQVQAKKDYANGYAHMNWLKGPLA